jgi:hypothetical protein
MFRIENAYLFLCNICWDIDIHDSKIFTDGPVDILHNPVNLCSWLVEIFPMPRESTLMMRY